MTSNQPARRRREKIDLGHSHLQLSGKLQSQESESQKSSLASIGELANVTQATSLVTGVTANGRHGVITTFNGVIAADAETSFVLTNKYLSTSSVVQLSVQYDGLTLSNPLAHVKSLANGSCSIVLNNHGTAATNAVIKVHYLILGVAP